MQAAVVQGSDALRNNFKSLDRAAEQAVSEQAHILVTPEMFLTGYNIGAAAVRAAAEGRDGKLLQRVAELAAAHQIAIVVGFPELARDGAVYNSAAFIGADGSILSVYQKTHLFGAVDRAQFSAGSALPKPFSYLGWKISLAICYDIEFPELARDYAKGGADIVLVPTANMAPFTRVATHMVPVRAQENVMYVAYANYVGSEGEFDYCGLSCLCDPLGDDIARAGVDSATLIYGSVSRQVLLDARKTTTYLQDRRCDLYSAGENNCE